jgi:hypothetical protein
MKIGNSPLTIAVTEEIRVHPLLSIFRRHRLFEPRSPGGFEIAFDEVYGRGVRRPVPRPQ